MLPFLFNVLQTIAVEDRTEVRARSVDSELVADVETDPQLKYRAEWKNGLNTFSLNYSPRIVFTNLSGKLPPAVAPLQTDPNDAAAVKAAKDAADAATQAAADASDVRKVDFIHRFGGALQLRLGPRTNFAGLSTVSYGTASLGTILIQPRWNGEDRPAPPLPFPRLGAARLEVLSTYSVAQVFHQVTPRFSITPGFVFITYGAPTFEGRKIQPYLENPAARLELNYAMTPRDDFALDIQPQFNVFTGSPLLPDPVDPKTNTTVRPVYDANGVRNPAFRFDTRTAPILYQGYAEARIKHRFSDLTSAEIAGGTSVTAQDRSTRPDDLYNVNGSPTQMYTNVYPVAEIALLSAFRSGKEGRGRFYGYARLNPWLNPLSGEILRRIDYVAAFALTFGLNQVRAQGAYAETLPGEIQAFRQVTGELSYERRLSQTWSVDIGGRVGYQELVVLDDGANQASSTTTFQPGGYLGITYRPLPLKL